MSHRTPARAPLTNSRRGVCLVAGDVPLTPVVDAHLTSCVRTSGATDMSGVMTLRVSWSYNYTLQPYGRARVVVARLDAALTYFDDRVSMLTAHASRATTGAFVDIPVPVSVLSAFSLSVQVTLENCFGASTPAVAPVVFGASVCALAGALCGVLDGAPA